MENTPKSPAPSKERILELIEQAKIALDVKVANRDSNLKRINDDFDMKEKDIKDHYNSEIADQKKKIQDLKDSLPKE